MQLSKRGIIASACDLATLSGDGEGSRNSKNLTLTYNSAGESRRTCPRFLLDSKASDLFVGRLIIRSHLPLRLPYNTSREMT